MTLLEEAERFVHLEPVTMENTTANKVAKFAAQKIADSEWEVSKLKARVAELSEMCEASDVECFKAIGFMEEANADKTRLKDEYDKLLTKFIRYQDVLANVLEDVQKINNDCQTIQQAWGLAMQAEMRINGVFDRHRQKEFRNSNIGYPKAQKQ